MYLCVNSIDYDSFYNGDFGTIPTVWYVLFFVLFVTILPITWTQIASQNRHEIGHTFVFKLIIYSFNETRCYKLLFITALCFHDLSW
jgi:hypothetical protein